MPPTSVRPVRVPTPACCLHAWERIALQFIPPSGLMSQLQVAPTSRIDRDGWWKCSLRVGAQQLGSHERRLRARAPMAARRHGRKPCRPAPCPSVQARARSTSHQSCFLVACGGALLTMQRVRQRLRFMKSAIHSPMSFASTKHMGFAAFPEKCGARILLATWTRFYLERNFFLHATGSQCCTRLV